MALLAILLLVLSAGGTGWWLLARDRDAARADLAAEKVVSEGVRGAIREQNRAVEAMGTVKTVAEARGAQAQQVAAANGRRLDQVLNQERKVVATTCDQAMPTVEMYWELSDENRELDCFGNFGPGRARLRGAAGSARGENSRLYTMCEGGTRVPRVRITGAARRRQQRREGAGAGQGDTLLQFKYEGQLEAAIAGCVVD